MQAPHHHEATANFLSGKEKQEGKQHCTCYALL
jgi:hypothetical protein